MTIRNFFWAVLAGIALVVLAPPARATFEVFVYDDGALQFSSTGTATTVSYSGTTTHFSITNGSGSSNNTGSSISFMQLSGNAVIAATFGAPGTHTLTVVESENGWTAPTGSPIQLTSAGGGSYLLDKAGNSVSASYQGFLDTSNALYPGGMSLTTPAGGSDTKQTASGSTVGVSTGFSYTPSPDVAMVPGGTPFTITAVQTYSFTLVSGSTTDTANASDTTSAQGPGGEAPTPAPAGLVLVLTGLPCLGLGHWLWRRRQPS